MAFIDESCKFDPDAIETEVVGIAARLGQHDSGMHSHAKAQLLYAPQGCMTITLDGLHCVLPPTRAAWIPPACRHSVVMNRVVDYRSLYFAPQLTGSIANRIQILEVTPLLQALVERMAFWPWDKSAMAMVNTYQLFFEELSQAKESHLVLPMPSDRRLQTWLAELQRAPWDVPPLKQLGQQLGASSKTISRIFTRQTGMPYQNWRQQWRLQQAIALLASGYQVNDVAYRLAFSSDSAFIAFFKQHTGSTPLQYLQPKY
ncbi:helix-turn-helix domain-containing protein [Shewanella loihica]|uniref:Transcriptional regulator, AraC family n=1 Tax=Shewanella loihica (strain ATCC BAA-1088 / PV-4) TaxID=323850 RepID=A3QIW8_SHELP|nr:helix-turn-helix transcriptional regulator [Shewanella loihica]ABO25416.1 transcriptional regulator, AraC family [Shewanella loihica PV-4]